MEYPYWGNLTPHYVTCQACWFEAGDDSGGKVVHYAGIDPGAKELIRSQKSIFLFWLPLAATWLMMAVEGPFLAAVIARLADPVFNLAAHGVAFAFALVVEAPVIMIMSASTALADNAGNYRRLRNFTFAMNAWVTGVLLVLLTPPVFDFCMLDVMALPEEVARLTYVSLWFYLPWAAAIGYRRFFNGLMIRDSSTRYVAYCTVVRLTTMVTIALLLYYRTDFPGAWVGAASLSVGVTLEAIASRLMARTSVRKVLAIVGDAAEVGEQLSYRAIAYFYYPLALTSIIGLALQPALTFFMGRAPLPLESLAVFPVVGAVSFIFRSMGLSYQEVAIALMGERHQHLPEINQFAWVLGIASCTGLALVALTPASSFWFGTVSGLQQDLAQMAILPMIILIPVPGLTILLSVQRAILVTGKHTGPITWATVIEVGLVLACFPIFAWGFGVVGVTSAIASFLIGRSASCLYMVAPCRSVVAAGR
jgi:hypothetical protein